MGGALSKIRTFFTGRNREQESDLYANYDKIDTVIEEINSIATIEHIITDGVPQIVFRFIAETISGNYPPQWATAGGGKISANSSASILGHPTYIDCELGDAYKIESGEIISLNSKVVLGSDMPVLAPGSNKITFDNTITDLKIAPRWWRI